MMEKGTSSAAKLSAIVVVIAGIAFWVRNPITVAFHAERWWALFLMVPAVFLMMPRGGVRPARGRILAAGGVLGVAAVFLLTPGFGVGWPLLLCVLGLVGLFA